jgi:hypothetical protein
MPQGPRLAHRILRQGESRLIGRDIEGEHTTRRAIFLSIAKETMLAFIQGVK